MEIKNKHQYFGRYSQSTGFYTKPNGERVRMTFEEYIKFIEETRGLYPAHKIKQKTLKRISKKERD